MKTKIVMAVVAIGAISVMARMLSLFSTWDDIKKECSCISVVRCGSPVIPPPGVFYSNHPRSDSDVQIVAVLKGTNNTGAARLESDHTLYEGENYLVFGNFENSVYRADENFKVVPLGKGFSTNSIAGKNLDEQIQQLFKQALFQLDREIKEDQEQRAQLETAITKR